MNKPPALNPPVRVGIIGMGVGAAVQIPAFQSIPEIIIAGLADGGSGRAQKIADNNVPRPRAFKCAEDLIADKSIDLISLAVPPACQHKLAEIAINNVKHIICEKPFGHDAKKALALAEKAKLKGIQNIVSYQFRYEAGIRALANILAEGKIGEIRDISVNWHTSGGRNPNKIWTWRDSKKSSTGVLGEFCSHVFDYASLLLGAPIVEIDCKETQTIKTRPDDNGDEKPLETSDSCEIICRFANGCTGQFSVSNAALATTGHKIEIHGSKGVGIFHHKPPFYNRDAIVRVVTPDSDCLLPLNIAGNTLELESDSRIGAFALLTADFISGRAMGQADFFHATDVLKVIAAAIKSVKTGRAVVV